MEIDSLDSDERGCYASNEYLAQFCLCSERKVSDAVSKLIELGYITQDGFDGRSRILRSCIAKTARQSSRFCESDDPAQYNYENTSNKHNNKAGKPQKRVWGDFDAFWSAYPKKVGKQAALKAFQKANATLETMLTAIERQKSSAQWKKDNGQYIPNPATWLNQGRWEDEEYAATNAPKRYTTKGSFFDDE